MKKQILLLAGCALILASCGSNNNEQKQDEQAKMDSMANANKALQDEINKKKNDSTINAMAAAKADSIEKANAAKEHSSKTTKTTKTTKETPPPPAPAPAPAPTVGNGKPSMRDQGNTTSDKSNTIGNGKPKMK